VGVFGFILDLIIVEGGNVVIVWNGETHIVDTISSDPVETLEKDQ